MKSLSINGQKLHEVQMLRVPYDPGSISYTQYPKHRIKYHVTENTVVVEIPAMLALELFRKGVLTSDENAENTLSVSGKKIGKYIVFDFRYPKDYSDMITIKFKKI